MSQDKESNELNDVNDVNELDKLDEQLKANLEGNFELGWKLCQELEQERPNCNRCAFNRGWMLLRNGEMKKGFECINRGRYENVFGSPPLNTDKPIWGLKNPATPDSKHILFRSEGGLGDEMINVRFISDIKRLTNAKITVSCSKHLMSVFSRVEGVDAVVQRDYEEFVYHDCWVPAMSAISCLDYEYSDLSGKSYLTALGKPNLGGKIKVGLRWSGNPEFEHQQFRKFDPDLLLNITKDNPDISFYSFQKDLDLKDLREHTNVEDLSNLLSNWEYTLSFLNDMDLVITSCTSIAHAAAALGKETWVITPILPYYIWALPGNKSPWYDKNWNPLFDNINEDLKKFVFNFQNKMEKE